MSRYQVSGGKIVKGWTVRLDPTPEQAAQFRRDCGARRFACNWAIAQITTAFEHGTQTGEHDRQVWSAWALRKRWDRMKEQATALIDAETGVVSGSWWAECSKEAYAGGIADAVTALKNWQDSRTGTRAGPRVGFPRLAARRGEAREPPGKGGGMNAHGRSVATVAKEHASAVGHRLL